MGNKLKRQKSVPKKPSAPDSASGIGTKLCHPLKHDSNRRKGAIKAQSTASNDAVSQSYNTSPFNRLVYKAWGE